MINCNIHNYRQHIQAYLNEKLAGEDMLAVESFLQQHPDIMDEYLLELEDLKLEKDTRVPVSFSHLVINIISTQNIHADNYTQYFVNYYEKELNDSDKKETENFVQLNPHLQKEFKIYSSVYLKADSSIVYPNKNSLYKKSRPAVALFGSIAAAASVALIITVYILWPSPHNPNAIALKNTVDVITPTLLFDKYTLPDNSLYTDPNPIIQKNRVNESNEKWFVKNKSQKNIQQKENKNNSMQVALVDMNLNSPIILTNSSPSVANHQPKTALNDIELYNNSPVAENKPAKKGFFQKLFSGDKMYIEEYVNATFTAFNEKPEGSDWILKVERDESGKSKRIKFSSPIFSIKSKN